MSRADSACGRYSFLGVLKVLARRLRWCSAVVSALVIAGCASGTNPYASSVRMVSALWLGDYPDNVPPAPDLKYAYLRVDFDDRPPGMMVLGYRDPDDVEVWYSSTQQAFKMQRGRLVSVLGMSDNWTAVRFSPEVPDLTQGLPTPVHYRRSRDEMPGYRYGAVSYTHLTLPTKRIV